MELICAVLWTIIFIVDFIDMLIDNEPSWILVFCPLILLVLEYWEQYFRDH